jgi:sugar lactone lactonase YvrE
MRTIEMPNYYVRSLTLCAAVIVAAQVVFAADILINDPKSSPESLAVAPGGVLIVGSASSPFVYKVKAGAATADKFIDATAEGPGTSFLGMLVDASSNTLWTCQLTPVAGAPMRRGSALRGFDVATGAPKIKWDLPGESTICNDFAIGPDKALYITDTLNAKIYRLAAGATAAELFLEDRASLAGIDGITFLNGTLYVNNVRTSKIYRVPVEAGKASPAVEIVLDQPLKGPDGMRAGNGKLLVAENGAGKVSAITVTGDKGTVTMLKDGLMTPTAVEPAGDTIWIAERATGKAVSIPMPK